MFYSFLNKNNVIKNFLIATVCGVLLLITACTKGSLVGNDILPADDLIQVVSDTTFSITAKTIDDSNPLIFNSELGNDSSFAITTFPLGSYNDPIFGRSSSTLFLQPIPSENRPNSAWFVSPAGVRPIDSIVLVLPYTENAFQYGDTIPNQKVSVFRVTEDMSQSVKYRTSKDFTTESTPIANDVEFSPVNKKRRVTTHKYISTYKKDKDSLVWTTTETYPKKELRIKLSPSVYADLMDPTKYADNNTFTSFFKGLKIAPNLANTALLNFDLFDGTNRAGIYMYQHDTSSRNNVVNNLISNPNRVRDTLTYTRKILYFQNSDVRPRTALYANDRTGTQLPAAFAAPASQTENIYLQGLGGPIAKLNFTNLKAQLGKAVINKAELFVVTPNETDPKYRQPNVIFAYRKNNYGSLIEIRDLQQSAYNAAFYPYYGRRNLERINGQTLAVYNMNIGDHIQDIVNGKYPAEMYLAIFNKRIRAERLVIKQNKAQNQGFFLRIQYTKL